MGMFDGIKEKAIREAELGRKPREKNPSKMTNSQLERKITGNGSLTSKRKYAEEKLRREGRK